MNLDDCCLSPTHVYVNPINKEEGELLSRSYRLVLVLDEDCPPGEAFFMDDRLIKEAK